MRGAPGRKRRRGRRWGSRAEAFRSERSRRMRRHALDDNCRREAHPHEASPARVFSSMAWFPFSRVAELSGGLAASPPS